VGALAARERQKLADYFLRTVSARDACRLWQSLFAELQAGRTPSWDQLPIAVRELGEAVAPDLGSRRIQTLALSCIVDCAIMSSTSRYRIV
jgi:hypothetical protein